MKRCFSLSPIILSTLTLAACDSNTPEPVYCTVTYFGNGTMP
jgi:hypothetical protein